MTDVTEHDLGGDAAQVGTGGLANVAQKAALSERMLALTRATHEMVALALAAPQGEQLPLVVDALESAVAAMDAMTGRMMADLPRRDERATMTREEAMALAIDWAEGRRSYVNLGPHPPYTPDVIAVMDAQEVVKWTAIAASLDGGGTRSLGAERTLRILRDNITRISARADGNYNANDLLWALEEAIQQAREEESTSDGSEKLAADDDTAARQEP